VDETYHYDALTRRIVTETAAETRHYYFNSQWRAIEERVSGAVKAQYVWNPADRWDLIRRKRSVAGTLDEIRFVLRDYLDPAAIINESGTVTERYRYDAFGPLTVLAPDFSVRTTSECAWNFLYHAEFIDALTGLYNYGYRYYHPGLGRWISRDPIGEEGGLNLYEFVGNDGISRFDMLGNKCGKSFELSEQLLAALEDAWQDTLQHKTEQGGSVIETKSGVILPRVPRKAGKQGEIAPEDFPRTDEYPGKMLGTFHTHPPRPDGDDDRTLSCRDVAALAQHSFVEGKYHRVGPGDYSIVRSRNCIFVLLVDDKTKLRNCDNCCESACNMSSVKVRITSKPAIWPMERSGIGQIAGRRRPLPPESGLAGARPWLDNGGVKI
jgi:RHS repeat-associated protein